MRYSAIHIFNDGSFLDTSPYSKSEALDNISDGKLKAFFNKHKYVVVEVEDKNIGGVPYTYIVFKEEHPMFNLPITVFNISDNLYTHPRVQRFKSKERDEIYKIIKILREYFEREV